MKDKAKGAASSRRSLSAFFVYLVIILAVIIAGLSAFGIKNTLEKQKGNELVIADQNKEIAEKLSEAIGETAAGTVKQHQLQQAEADRISTPGNALNPYAASLQEASGEADRLPMFEIEGISLVGILKLGDDKTFAVADVSSEADDCFLPYYVSGDPASGDLLIRGTGSDAQLGWIKDAEPGDSVTFTDISGIQYSYETISVSKIEMSRIREAVQTPVANGIVVTSEQMRRNSEIDLQLYYDEGDRYRVVMDCKAVRGENGSPKD